MQNPFFVEPLPECEPCESVRDVRIMNKAEAVRDRKDYIGLAEPVLIMVKPTYIFYTSHRQ